MFVIAISPFSMIVITRTFS